MKLVVQAVPEALRRAGIHFAEGRLAQAEGLCRAILGAHPDTFDAIHLMALIETRRGQAGAALATYDRALALRPDHVEALGNRGVALKTLKRFDEAVASYDRALALRPDYAKAWYNRGIALLATNRHAEARASFARAIEIQPDYGAARFAACIAELPMVYADAAEIDARRDAYGRALDDLVAAAARPEFRRTVADAVGGHQPYYLAYQARNDRDLQARYGELVCALAAEKYGSAVLAQPAAAGESIRVGIVSGFFQMHSVWKIPLGGWLGQLDRSRFKVFGYHTAATSDATTAAAAEQCERFVRGPLPIATWRQQILSDAPHVLIYPEIGMDPVVPALAAQRLAPAQCNAGGHPVTSGLPTIDYFLSSALMEPTGGDDHYTEKLVRLPNLMIYYVPVAAPKAKADRAGHGLRPDATLFWCGQTGSKYLPQYDEVFARIAKAAGDCQFVFVHHAGGAHVTDLLRQRLQRAFAGVGLAAADHCVFLPRLSMADYGAAMGLCDVFLDSIGWSGNNTAMESLAHDLPIVTLPGSMMRARHSSAILQRMDITDTIAAGVDEYIAIAVRLARDPEWRIAIKAKVALNKHRIYRDRAAIEGLEQFLERVARRPAVNP